MEHGLEWHWQRPESPKLHDQDNKWCFGQFATSELKKAISTC